ncbi:MAG: prolyl-tRNA synthetase associated domain-containing protein [Alphaproteobacteria bacterium]|nr:prolyl-tRNA synthetase associated domain-containing protein [Alphaproteobacteria bacterium]
MPVSPEYLFSYLDRLGIAHSTVEHPPMFTVHDGKAWLDKIPGAHCKNLFLKDKNDKIWLAVMPAAKRADIGKLQKRIGSARLSFGKPELLREVLGIAPGSVTPFALLNDTDRRVAVILDSDMVNNETVNYHPLRNNASTTLKMVDFLKFIRALNYEPFIVDCGA